MKHLNSARDNYRSTLEIKNTSEEEDDCSIPGEKEDEEASDDDSANELGKTEPFPSSGSKFMNGNNRRKDTEVLGLSHLALGKLNGAAKPIYTSLNKSGVEITQG